MGGSRDIFGMLPRWMCGMSVVGVPSASPNEEGQGHYSTGLGCLVMWILTPALAFSLKECVGNMPCIAFAPSRDQIVPLNGGRYA